VTPTLNTYFYQFNHRSSFLKKPDWVKGADHADIYYYCYGDYFMDSPISRELIYTEDEINLSKTIMRYYANLAKTG